jgi:hypothetical protein
MMDFLMNFHIQYGPSPVFNSYVNKIGESDAEFITVNKYEYFDPTTVTGLLINENSENNCYIDDKLLFETIKAAGSSLILYDWVERRRYVDSR